MPDPPRFTSADPVSRSTTGAMSSSLRLKVNLGFALALVILCVVGGAALWNTQRFAQAARERRQGFEVRIRITLDEMVRVVDQELSR
jgi:CHASE3 domain sensor protein